MEGLIREIVDEDGHNADLRVDRDVDHNGTLIAFKFIYKRFNRIVLSVYIRDGKYRVNWGLFSKMPDMTMDDPHFPEAFKERVREQIKKRCPELVG